MEKLYDLYLSFFPELDRGTFQDSVNKILNENNVTLSELYDTSVSRLGECYSLLDDFPLSDVPQTKKKSAKHYYAYTNDLGRALIDLGYPMLGAGSMSLVFSLSPEWTAKVPHDLKGQYERGLKDRERDLLLSGIYPCCFAQTKQVCMIFPFENGYKTDQAILQERLVPKTLNIEKLYRHVRDREKFLEMTLRYPVRQFGIDREGHAKGYDYE
jgi:hypothetical protein